MIKKFLRRDTVRFSKLGKNRKKLQRWKRPKGRDSKTRLNRKGYPRVVSVGYKAPKSERNKLIGLKPVIVHNPKGLDKIGKNSIVIIGKIGARKKLELIKKAEEKGIRILNLKKIGLKK